MIRMTAATTIKDRDFNSDSIVERALNGHTAAFSIPGVVPVESKAEVTEEHEHNAINVNDNSIFFN